jgi:hypothetical protein
MKRRPARETAERVLLQTGLFSGEPAPKDDQTVVIVRRKLPEPKGRPSSGEFRAPATPGPGTRLPSGGAPPAAAPPR